MSRRSGVGDAGPSNRNPLNNLAANLDKGKTIDRSQFRDFGHTSANRRLFENEETASVMRERELSNQQARADAREAQQQARIDNLERILAERGASPRRTQDARMQFAQRSQPLEEYDYNPRPMGTGVGLDPALNPRHRSQRAATNRTSAIIDEELLRAEQEVERLRRLQQQRTQTRSPLEEPPVQHQYYPRNAYNHQQPSAATDVDHQRSKLRANDVMLWDPAKYSVRFFIDRLESVAAVEGVTAVLRVLPLCLTGDALDWHTSLPRYVQDQMNVSLEEWKIQLTAEFKPDVSKAHDAAFKLRFRFEDQDELPLNSYLRRKRSLMTEAGMSDDRTIIYQTWRGLDIMLVAITPVIDGETWLQFCARVRQNESAAYRSWQSEQWRKKSDSRFNASRPRFDTTRREYSGRQDNTGFMRPQTTGNRINKSPSKAKSSPAKRPIGRDPLGYTTGNRPQREWIPQEKWDQMRKDGTLPPRSKLFLVNEEDDREDTEAGDYPPDHGYESSDPDSAYLAGITLEQDGATPKNE
jgi:hypothetical protein